VPASKALRVAWVVKSWKVEALDAHLEALERLGLETRAEVRDQRRRPKPEPAPEPVAARPRPRSAARSRRPRASLRDSPLTVLMQSVRPG